MTGTPQDDGKGKNMPPNDDDSTQNEESSNKSINTTVGVKAAAIPSGSGGHDSSFWKSPILKRGEYGKWIKNMETHVRSVDPQLWRIIKNGDIPSSMGTAKSYQKRTTTRTTSKRRRRTTEQSRLSKVVSQRRTRRKSPPF